MTSVLEEAKALEGDIIADRRWASFKTCLYCIISEGAFP